MYPQHGWIAKQAEQIRRKFDQPDPNNIPAPQGWVEWINKPQVPEAFELELSGHSKSVLSTCFARDNRTLLSGSADGTIRVWDSQTGELHAQLEDHQGAVTCVRLSPDGSMMASVSADKTIRLWKFPGNEIIRLAFFYTAATDENIFDLRLSERYSTYLYYLTKKVHDNEVVIGE